MSDCCNPIQYTSKTFQTILDDINSDTDLVDKPNWFKRLIAGIGDVISMWNNATANNMLLRTAFTRRNVTLLLELIDYTMTPQTTANGTVIFYIKSTASFPFSVAKSNLVGLTQGSIASSAKRFEARNSSTVTLVTEDIQYTDVNISTDQLTVTRDFTTGEKVILSTTGTMPTPLTAGTEYYVIRVDATNIQLATSLANAYSGTNIDITAQGTGTHTIDLYSFQTTLYQQESKDSVIIGTSDGTSEFQEFDLPDLNILEDTVEVLVNGVAFTRVDTLIDSISTDNHFRLYYNSDDSSFIRFGNGEFGAIPSAFDVEVSYAYGGGNDSNVSTVDSINSYGGNNSNIDGVSNQGSMTGGANAESIESAKILGPLLLKARDRFVTNDDAEAIALSYGGISQVKSIPNAFGVLSVKVVAIANGGGNPSTALKGELQTYLIERSILESIDVRVQDTTITSIAVTSAGKVLSGYVWTGQVGTYFDLAWKLFLSEAGEEIQSEYEENGISSAVSLINTIFSTSFDSADYTFIIPLIENLEPRLIGEDIQESDVFSYIGNSVIGLDYVTISSPSFPISLADDEITTPGTLTLTEIT